MFKLFIGLIFSFLLINPYLSDPSISWNISKVVKGQREFDIIIDCRKIPDDVFLTDVNVRITFWTINKDNSMKLSDSKQYQFTAKEANMPILTQSVYKRRAKSSNTMWDIVRCEDICFSAYRNLHGLSPGLIEDAEPFVIEKVKLFGILQKQFKQRSAKYKNSNVTAKQTIKVDFYEDYYFCETVKQ